MPGRSGNLAPPYAGLRQPVQDSIFHAGYYNQGFDAPEPITFDKPDARPGLTGPQFQTRTLPGLNDDQPAQMPLFNTTRVGKQEYYSKFRSPDANDWTDSKPAIDAVEIFEGRRDLDPGYQAQSMGRRGLDKTGGAFETWDNGPEEQEYLASRAMHGDLIKSHGELGHSGQPTLAPLQFNELQRHETMADSQSYPGQMKGLTTWSTPAGTPVAKVDWRHAPDWHEPLESRDMHDDPLGTLINTAEVHPLYKGRGYSKGIMADLGDSVSDTPGIMHADGFTDEGSAAFNAKGAPLDEHVREWRNDALEAQGLKYEQPFKEPNKPDGSSGRWRFPANEEWGEASAQWKRQMAFGQEALIAPLRDSLGLPDRLKPRAKKAVQDTIPGL